MHLSLPNHPIHLYHLHRESIIHWVVHPPIRQTDSRQLFEGLVDELVVLAHVVLAKADEYTPTLALDWSLGPAPLDVVVAARIRNIAVVTSVGVGVVVDMAVMLVHMVVAAAAAIVAFDHTVYQIWMMFVGEDWNDVVWVDIVALVV